MAVLLNCTDTKYPIVTQITLNSAALERNWRGEKGKESINFVEKKSQGRMEIKIKRLSVVEHCSLLINLQPLFSCEAGNKDIQLARKGREECRSGEGG